MQLGNTAWPYFFAAVAVILFSIVWWFVRRDLDRLDAKRHRRDMESYDAMNTAHARATANAFGDVARLLRERMVDAATDSGFDLNEPIQVAHVLAPVENDEAIKAEIFTSSLYDWGYDSVSHSALTGHVTVVQLLRLTEKMNDLAIIRLLDVTSDHNWEYKAFELISIPKKDLN